MMRAQFKQYTDVPVNNVTYNVIKLHGKGKGGYSYLAQRDGRQYVIKQSRATTTPSATKLKRSKTTISG